MNVIIKKYANRRLYDTESSRYITLEELAEKIRSGTDVQVVDAASGEDLTQATLAQIIIESRGAGKLLPTSLLVQLIRLRDEALAEFLNRYVSAALDMYLKARQGAQQMAQYNPLASMPFDAVNAMARMWGGGAPFFGAAEEPATYTRMSSPNAWGPNPSTSSDEVADLRREMEELKQAMRGARKEPPPRKKK